MITVHHLNDSRSQRVLWLLEELAVPYEIRHYARDAMTRLAPPELQAVHPLGKSPVITDGDTTVIESGAIVDYLLRRHGAGRLQPAALTADHEAYLQWLHYAEGSAMLPLMLKLYVSRLGDAGAPLAPRIDSELANHLGYVDRALQGRDWLVGNEFSGADIQMSFVGEAARGLRASHPALDAWVRRFQQRPAYQRALERGGPYSLADAQAGRPHATTAVQPAPHELVQHVGHRDRKKVGGMVQGFPRLLGDIGGTNARWAWQAAPGATLQHYTAYPCAQFDSVQAVIEQFLRDQRLPTPSRVAFGIATPITGDLIQMTNHHWTFSVLGLQSALGVERCLVLNDFAAIAAALPALQANDSRRIGGGDAVSGAPVAVLGPGTGLGVAGLVQGDAGRYIGIAGEGGHVTLAASTAREASVLAQLHQRFGHASAERALSGPGLVNLCEAICAVDGLRSLALTPADVTAHAAANSDPVCVEALNLFGGFLGSVAGNLALTLGARGGIYIGGGIVPRLGAAFDALPFRQRFEDKGRFRSYLERIPTAVITMPAPALYGAASALDALPD